MMNGRDKQNGNSQIQPSVEQKEFDQLPMSSWPVQGTNKLINFAPSNQPMPPNPGPYSNRPMPPNPNPGPYSNQPMPPNPGPYSNRPMPPNPNPGPYSNQPMPPNPGLKPQWQGLQTTSISFVDPRSMQRQEMMVPPHMPLTTIQDSSGPSQMTAQKKKPLVVICAIIGLVLLLAGAGGYYYWKKANATTDVTLYQVNSQNVVQDIGGSGLAYAKTSVDLSYPTLEKITNVMVHTGDHVKAKQALLKIDLSQTNVQLTELANEEAQAQSFLQTVQNSAGANSVSIAQAQQAYNIAKGRYDQLASQTSSYTFSNGQVLSPIDGIVTAVNANPGGLANPYSPLITVQDESTIVVHAEIPLSSLGQVSVGQSAVVTPSALPNTILNGTVTNIVLQANAQTDTFEIWVSVPNTTANFLPGMTAFVHIQKPAHAYVVPRLAVLNPDRDSAVFVVREQHAYLQHVHIVGRSLGSIYIDSGLSNGEQLVLVGLYALNNGQAVHVAKVESAFSGNNVV